MMKVILVDVDCLRADKVGVYGGRAELTPWLDRLAQAGTLFSQAITAADTTGPSHASIFTSSYPFVHRFIRNAMRFPRGQAKLAQLLQEAGVATAAAVGVEHLSTFFRFGEGFDAYYNSHWFDRFFHYAMLVRLPGFRLSSLIDKVRRRFPQLDTHSCEGVQVNARISRWIERHAGHDFFAWLHYFDLHYPYDGEAGYEAKVQLVDGLIGELVELTEKLGIREETVFIVTSDHGEAFGEHGHFQHKNAGLYDETIRVPLIVSGGGLPQGQRVESQVRTIDLAPTVLDLFGLPIPSVYQGDSLLPWIHRERHDHLVALSYGYPTDRGSKCIRTGEWKYICHRDGQDELYHLAEDPGERENLMAEMEDLVKELKVLFFDLENHPEASDEEIEDAMLRHMLEGLGYL
jgi:arylsulfatase A-like enzyme